MSDDETLQPPKVLPFRVLAGGKTGPVETPPAVAPPPDAAAPRMVQVRMGLFPLGSGDYMVTATLLNHLVGVLELGTAEERAAAAQWVRQLAASFLVTVPTEDPTA